MKQLKQSLSANEIEGGSVVTWELVEALGKKG